MPDDFGRVAIGVRHGGPVATGFLECWTRFLVAGTRDGDEILAPAIRKPAHLAANLLVRGFLASTADSLLFVDDDHAFRGDTLERLRSRAESWQYDAVGALYTARGVGRPLILAETPDSKARPSGDGDAQYFWPTEWNAGDVLEVDGLGLGFTLIRRRVFEGLPEPWFYYPRMVDTSSEDLPFFRDARRAGFRLAVDTALPIGHLMDNFAHTVPKEYMDKLAAVGNPR